MSLLMCVKRKVKLSLSKLFQLVKVDITFEPIENHGSYNRRLFFFVNDS